MSVMLKIDVRVERADLNDRVGRLKTFLGSPQRMHLKIRPGMEEISKDWIIQQAAYRHETALRLGAAPTGELLRAATKVASYADSKSAKVQFGSPLLARAMGDVTIKPGAGKTYLTIPVSGEAYGKRIANLERSIGKLRFLGKPGGRAMVAARFEPGEKVGTAHYLLVKEVHQKQDRTLLPSDEDYMERAGEDLEKAVLREWRERQ